MCLLNICHGCLLFWFVFVFGLRQKFMSTMRRIINCPGVRWKMDLSQVFIFYASWVHIFKALVSIGLTMPDIEDTFTLLYGLFPHNCLAFVRSAQTYFTSEGIAFNKDDESIRTVFTVQFFLLFYLSKTF